MNEKLNASLAGVAEPVRHKKQVTLWILPLYLFLGILEMQTYFFRRLGKES